MEKNDLVIDGKEYVLKSSIKPEIKAKQKDTLKYCIVRSYDSGVFAGYVGKPINREATIYNARRLWYWDGANSLSELAMVGVTKPQNCKFPIELPEIFVLNISEIIPCTEKARLSIADVKIWSQN